MKVLKVDRNADVEACLALVFLAHHAFSLAQLRMSEQQQYLRLSADEPSGKYRLQSHGTGSSRHI